MINLKIAHHKILLWIIAFFITVSSAIYQRVTGPTHPKRGKLTFQGSNISYKLSTSEIINKDIPIKLTIPDTTINGYLKFVRYKSEDEWTEVPFQRQADKLFVNIPHQHQEPAGKKMYYIYLTKDDQTLSLTGKEPVILRYKGEVPAAILLPHIFLMFFAMLLANRTGLEALRSKGKAYKHIITTSRISKVLSLEALRSKGKAYKLMLWTIGFFFVGGFILGPIMQKYAFGALWTGFPFGIDLTDNKTLIAMLGWLWAWYKNRGGRDGRGWIIFAAVLMLAIYLIPHSVLGSEIDYTKLPESP